MTTNIKAVKFELSDKDREYLDKKLERVKYGDDLITDLLITIKFDKQYFFDVTLNFRWGASAHVSADDFDLQSGINKMMDVLDQKVKKEKDKIQGR